MANGCTLGERTKRPAFGTSGLTFTFRYYFLRRILVLWPMHNVDLKKWLFNLFPLSCRTKNLQCSRIFQVGATVNTVCLHPNQTELIVGDQSGVIHVWDVRTDRNEQLVMPLIWDFPSFFNYIFEIHICYTALVAGVLDTWGWSIGAVCCNRFWCIRDDSYKQ